jgi:dCMP deaminase
MPSGWDNTCENFVGFDNGGEERLNTKPEVLHAEMNALMKLAKSTESGDGSSIFITHSPCLECAKGIYQAGIKEVYYSINYRNTDGIDFLEKCNIKIEKLDV